MENELQIPIAFCPSCDDEVPVIVETVLIDGKDAPEEFIGQEVMVVYCPECLVLLNLGNKDVKIKWYTSEDLEKATGWKHVKE